MPDTEAVRVDLRVKTPTTADICQHVFMLPHEYRLSYRHRNEPECRVWHSAKIDRSEEEAREHLADFREHNVWLMDEVWIERRPVLAWTRIDAEISG